MDIVTTYLSDLSTTTSAAAVRDKVPDLVRELKHLAESAAVQQQQQQQGQSTTTTTRTTVQAQQYHFVLARLKLLVQEIVVLQNNHLQQQPATFWERFQHYTETKAAEKVHRNKAERFLQAVQTMKPEMWADKTLLQTMQDMVDPKSRRRVVWDTANTNNTESTRNTATPTNNNNNNTTIATNSNNRMDNDHAIESDEFRFYFRLAVFAIFLLLVLCESMLRMEEPESRTETDKADL